MPFLSPLAGDDADDYYYGYDAGYRRGSGGGTGKSAPKKEKGIFSCLPCFNPICNWLIASPLFLSRVRQGFHGFLACC
jgi:hypothetical protein